MGKCTILIVDEVVEGLDLCLRSTCFTFNSKSYRQREGVAMESSVSPIAANLHMRDFEEKALAGFGVPPRIW